MMKKPANVNKALFFCAIVLSATMGTPWPSLAAKVDCETLFQTDKTKTYKIDPADMRQCIMRGYESPVEWRKNAGKSPGIKIGGANGIYYGAVVAPEATPGAYGANASVSKQVIEKACTFPPSAQSLKPGSSCYKYYYEALKDIFGNTKDQNTHEPPPTTDLCPAESDTTGAFGVKQTPTGNSTSLACGGMLPATNVRMVLNRNPNFLAVTSNGYRDIWFYQKSGTSYSLAKHALLPNYLCVEQNYGETQLMVKSVDLTPSIGQTISYDASVGMISIRLQSRSMMDPGYIPAYDPDVPEKYLNIPIDGSGNADVPTDCALETQYFDVPGGRRDIVVEPPPDIDGSCPSIAINPTLFKEPSCPQNATLGSDGKCHDNGTNAVVAAITTDVWKCPDSSAPGGYAPAPSPAPQSGCPQNNQIPAPKDYKVLCSDTGQPPVNGKCSATGDITLEQPSCGTPTTVCDIVTVSPDNASGACTGKTQYGVLNRANIYYPSGSNVKLYTVTSMPFNIAETVDGTRFFATGDTSVQLGVTAPPITLDDGATIRLNDKTLIIFNPPVTIEASSGKVIATGGGAHLSAGGTQMDASSGIPEPLLPGSSFVIPPSLLPSPLEVSLGRSFTLPSGFTIQTMNAPYIRIPQEPMPQ